MCFIALRCVDGREGCHDGKLLMETLWVNVQGLSVNTRLLLSVHRGREKRWRTCVHCLIMSYPLRIPAFLWFCLCHGRQLGIPLITVTRFYRSERRRYVLLWITVLIIAVLYGKDKTARPLYIESASALKAVCSPSNCSPYPSHKIPNCRVAV